jgi:hypothetical protein
MTTSRRLGVLVHLPATAVLTVAALLGACGGGGGDGGGSGGSSTSTSTTSGGSTTGGGSSGGGSSGGGSTVNPPLANATVDCSSEGGLGGRTDIAFCEPWQNANWWQNGYLSVASVARPQAATASSVANASIVSTGCISGSCLRVQMRQYESGALAVHFPLNAVGRAPEALYLRYYMKLGSNFDPTLCEPNGALAGSGGKFPGLADVRTNADPATQCGNGGAFGDGVNCWSMRAYYRDCWRGESTRTKACANSNATTRYGSYLYYYDQNGFNNAGIWDTQDWGQGYYDNPFGSCATARDIGGCGRGTGGQLVNDQWYLIEQYVKMNTPGQANGEVRGWVNGTLSYQKTNMIFRLPGHDNLHVRTVWLNVHAGGEFVGLCQGSEIFLDQMVVATGAQVGPWRAP